MNNKGSLILLGIFFGITAIFLIALFLPSSKLSPVASQGQYELEVLAKDGYSPRKLFAKAGHDLLLKIRTENTLDCSAFIVIPKIGFNEVLPPTGVKEVLIPAQANGTKITGSCSMGMYGFEIEFSDNV